MKRLKTIFACMLMALFSIGQVWGYTITFKNTSGNDGSQAKTAIEDIVSSGSEYVSSINATKVYQGKDGFGIKVGASSGSASITLSFSTSGQVKPTKIIVNACRWEGTSSFDTGNLSYKINGASTATTLTLTNSLEDHEISMDGNTTLTSLYLAPTTKRIYIKSITVETISTSPTVSVSPTSWDFGEVAASASASKVFSVSGSNLTAGTLSISVPAGFSVSPSSISVTEATLAATNVTVSKNTTAIDDYSGNLSISATCGLTEAKTVALNMSVVEDPEETGTFELFSGALEEGEYIICSGTNALKNTATSSPRIEAATVTISENKIENPNESLVWKIEALTGDDDGYWTFYNEAGHVYAAFTSTNARGNVIASVTDYAKWTTEDEGPSYDFTNKGLTSKYLRFNNGYGFASYATSTGEKLTLYKKQVEGQPKAPTFSVPGGNYENAQSVELSCETQGAKIYYTLDGSKPSSTSTEYSTAIPVSATTTIKAVAIKDEIESTVATATYTIIVWQTVADVWDDITADGPTNAHIYGYVSQTNVGGYANNFYISDNGSMEGNQLYAYRMDMNSFSVEVGDKVKLAGDLTIVNEKKQFKYANSGATQGLVVALEAKGALQSVAVSGTPTKTEYASGEDFEPAGLKVFGTYANGFVGEITEGITWGNDLTDGKVTENTTVHVTATVNEVTSPAYDVAVTVAAKTLESIAVGTASYTIYTGETLPKPVVTATFSEGEPEDVSAFAVYDTEDVFNTATIDNPDPQTITVSYTFGGATETVTYTVSVKDYANANDAPYTVTEALHIITDAIGSTESAREIVVAGTVNEDNISNNKNRYKISDGENELLVYAGKGFDKESFTNANYPKVGDVVVVKGNVINYNGNTPEFASGKSYLLSQVRPTTLAIEDIASFEVGATDLTESDLDITTSSDGDITFVSGDETKATIVANVAIHAVAPGTVTITANLAATENVAALNYAATSTTFDVTVVAATVKYAITFDGNENTGGEAPEFDAEAAEGANITLPANTYTKSGKIFDSWKVYDENQDEVTVTAGAFTMPASDVTIKAQWADPSVWALTYTSNVNIGTDSVILSSVKYAAKKAGTGSAWGSTTVMVPMGTTKLHFHAVCYGADASAVTLNVKKGESVIGTFIINKDTGAKGNSPFTLDNTPYQQYYSVTLSNISAETTLTFEADQEAEVNGKRFIIFGVNQEGGILPVLHHIEIDGTMTNTTGWKTGDAIEPEGLTVNAYYTLNDVLQDDPVDVTENVIWSHTALEEGQTEVSLTATYTENNVDKTDDIDVTIAAVVSGSPEITTDANNRYWTVDKDAAIPESKKFAVTLKNITSATVTKGGDDPDAFTVTPSTLTASGDITVSVVSTATVGSYAATITIKDDDSETSKVVNVSLTVNEPETPEAAISTTSEWVVAQAADLVDGKEVLITGVKDDVTYAMGGQNENNRAAVAGTLTENVFTPGANTMSFTLVAQETEGVFALRTSNGKYLYAASSGKNWLRSQADVDDNAKWTLSATSAVAESSTNRNVMQFNTSNSPKIFSCYAEAGGNGMAAIQFYVPKPAPKYSVTYAAGEGSGDAPDAVEYEENETFTVAAADLFTAPEGKEFDKWNDGTNDYEPGDTYTVGTADVVLTAQWKDAAPEPSYGSYNRDELTIGDYGTICLPQAGTISGAVLFAIGAYEGGMIMIDEIGSNEMVAGRPYIFQAIDNELTVTYTSDDEAVAGSLNGLYGSYDKTLLTKDDGNYILFNNLFYFVNSTNVYVGANRAYIKIGEINPTQPAPGRRRVAMSINGNQMPTEVENVEINNAPRKVVINGEMYIIRGEKRYDVRGQLVK